MHPRILASVEKSYVLLWTESAVYFTIIPEIQIFKTLKHSVYFFLLNLKKEK
jgi:hypothetical protein